MDRARNNFMSAVTEAAKNREAKGRATVARELAEKEARLAKKQRGGWTAGLFSTFLGLRLFSGTLPTSRFHLQ
jgi:hypothetical protein